MTDESFESVNVNVVYDGERPKRISVEVGVSNTYSDGTVTADYLVEMDGHKQIARRHGGSVRFRKERESILRWEFETFARALDAADAAAEELPFITEVVSKDG